MKKWSALRQGVMPNIPYNSPQAMDKNRKQHVCD